MDDQESLRTRWTHLYCEHLPALAKARDPVQPTWPVHLDHCFARIVLDNAVGVDRPWTEVVKAPAVKNMTLDQFKAAVELAEGIATGEEDLVALDERSLELRGKKGKGFKRKIPAGDEEEGEGKPKAAAKRSKKMRDGQTISSYFLPSPTSPIKHENGSNAATAPSATSTAKQPDISAPLRLIATSTITTFRKQCLTLLCHIPRGRYSTYQALSDHISLTSHKTCARAVGNAMKNNPFAPEVPCHRVIAADGRLGGFKGGWGVEGKFAGEKLRLLREEGVGFDSGGRVKGPVFREFGECW